MGFHEWVNLEVLEADDLNDVASQVVFRFDSQADRSAEMGSPVEGMISYIPGTGYETFDGTEWTELVTGGGEPGPAGPPGLPGGGYAAAYWQYSDQVTAPPGTGEIRTPAANDTMWISKTDEGGFNRSLGLSTVAEDDTLITSTAAGNVATWKVTGTPIDNTTYVTIPVTLTDGAPPATKNVSTQVALSHPAAAGTPGTPGATGPAGPAGPTGPAGEDGTSINTYTQATEPTGVNPGDIWIQTA